MTKNELASAFTEAHSAMIFSPLALKMLVSAA